MISDWYSDEELISQLQAFFDVEEDINFQELLGQITENEDGNFQLNVKGRTFTFGKEICNVEEVT